MAVREGMAKPVERPKQATGSEKPKEDGAKISQKILLTWMIEDRRLFGIIQKYISPEDFRNLCTIQWQNFISPV